MKKFKLSLVGALFLLLSACIPSVQPFYGKEDLTFDPRLLGEWQEQGKEEDFDSWTFEQSDGRTYKLTVIEKGEKRGVFTAHLFKLKEDFYLDLIPAECAFAHNQADLVGATVFPGHLLARVARIQPALALAFFDFGWLTKYLEKNPTALAHYREGDRVLLQATTKELQQFVLTHRGPGELFQQPAEFIRAPLPDSPSNGR